MIEDTHNYFDNTVNTFHQNICGNKMIEHNPSVITPKSEGGNRLQCFNCLKTNPGKSEKFRHLDYCSISIRPLVTQKKFKQLKITNFLEDDLAYQADSESSPDSGLGMDDIIEYTTPKSHMSNKKKRKVNKTNGNRNVDALTKLMEVLSTNKKKVVKTRYNLRKRKSKMSNIKTPKIQGKKICKNKKVKKVKNDIEIIDILEALRL